MVLSADDILDETAVDAMSVQVFYNDYLTSNFLIAFYIYSLQSGYSRFPVHEPGKPTSFIGLLLIKKVITFLFIYYHFEYLYLILEHYFI